MFLMGILWESEVDTWGDGSYKKEVVTMQIIQAAINRRDEVSADGNDDDKKQLRWKLISYTVHETKTCKFVIKHLNLNSNIFLSQTRKNYIFKNRHIE